MAKQSLPVKLRCKKCGRECYKNVKAGSKKVKTWCIKCQKDTMHEVVGGM